MPRSSPVSDTPSDYAIQRAFAARGREIQALLAENTRLRGQLAATRDALHAAETRARCAPTAVIPLPPATRPDLRLARQEGAA